MLMAVDDTDVFVSGVNGVVDVVDDCNVVDDVVNENDLGADVVVDVVCVDVRVNGTVLVYAVIDTCCC